MSNEDRWQEKLTPDQYQVMREKGTEAPFTGKYLDNKESGMYKCAACGAPLFSSDAKFDSGTGWPSFDAPVAEGKIKLIQDNSHGMSRTEVVCANCGSHLGHIFPDGPTPTGERYCINSVCLNLEKEEPKTL